MLKNHPLLLQLKKKFQNKIVTVKKIVKKNIQKFNFFNIEKNKKCQVSSTSIENLLSEGNNITSINIKSNKKVIMPLKLVKTSLKEFVGRIQKKNKKIFIIPEYFFLKESIICECTNDLKNKIQSNDWVLAKLLRYKFKKNKFFVAYIIKIIASKKNPLARWLITLAKYNLDDSAPKVKNYNFIVDSKYNRLDLTKLDFITIDNAFTKDIDDAVYITKNFKNEFVLTIAIADPTSYIPYQSELDTIAKNRGFTNYLPGFNVPMLPKELSENLCSLKPGMCRPALVCMVNISNQGNIIEDSIQFNLAWIKSKEKLIYENVSNWLENIGTWKPQSNVIANQIFLLQSLYKVRRQWRKKHTLIYKEKLEYKFNFSKNGEVIKITGVHRRIAHRIIEESMIIANMCAAGILTKKIGFGIYNVHIGYDILNAAQIICILKRYNILVNIKDICNLTSVIKLNKKLNILNNNYLNNRIRKFQAYSEFSITPKPHFGLGVKYYATWTSPIRKYGDMINHRLLKSIITNTSHLSLKRDVVIKISNCKRKNRMAERDISDWLYISYFKKNVNINDIFKGEIIDIFKAGMRICLINNGANAFVPFYLLNFICSKLVYHKNDGIIYEHNKPLYRVSDIIKVSIIDVKEHEKKIIACPFF
ncbi:exoribonuclease 2 [Buchnera aphidicola (Nipponaphis monzeni)]|uniref:Exoribonuclease II n=1 Tax=Buchnera aphidicola (Nipponaphis monzeni) TaxID=2495405 RepID=A0A455TA60_9GAMM|nr:exoribonuclease II [Buchnera aphidicola]BBI01221.1 exoribonuclease 2 [Buchnera aphidicola (Nipponaphis monzeni)]